MRRKKRRPGTGVFVFYATVGNEVERGEVLSLDKREVQFVGGEGVNSRSHATGKDEGQMIGNFLILLEALMRLEAFNRERIDSLERKVFELEKRLGSDSPESSGENFFVAFPKDASPLGFTLPRRDAEPEIFIDPKQASRIVVVRFGDGKGDDEK